METENAMVYNKDQFNSVYQSHKCVNFLILKFNSGNFPIVKSTRIRWQVHMIWNVALLLRANTVYKEQSIQIIAQLKD